MKHRRVLAVVATRPDAIKMAPVVMELRRRGISCELCSTGQHRELLTDALEIFSLVPDRDLGVMQVGQLPEEVVARVLTGMGDVLDRAGADLVLVHGDTSSAVGAALAAFYRGVPIAHVEAGLRSGVLRRPFPEEGNRRVIAQIADFHLAPTVRARKNLKDAGVPGERIAVTGNTIVDALALVRARIPTSEARKADGRRRLLVTSHRRENQGEVLDGICAAIASLTRRFDDLDATFVVHANPASRSIRERLGAVEHVRLLDPLSYPDFLALLMQADCVLTDSGGVQEEAACLGVPAVVLRAETDRPEAIDAGTAVLAGTGCAEIEEIAARILLDDGLRRSMAHASTAFGDGRAAERIVDALVRWDAQARSPIVRSPAASRRA